MTRFCNPTGRRTKSIRENTTVAPAAVGIRELLEAGVHFGHQTRRWNPKMRRFIHGEREGIYIIDLLKTEVALKKAQEFAQGIAQRGGVVLFVGTKKQARDSIKDVAESCGMPYVNQRWLGGVLTNFQTISLRIKRLHDLEKYQTEGQLELLPTQERMKALADLAKLQANLGGVKNMQRPPDAMFVIDLKTEAIAVKEAQRLRIPIIGLVDTNCDPDGIQYVIPGNDDAIKACDVIARGLGDVIRSGRAAWQHVEEERVRKEAEETARRQAEEAAKREAEEHARAEQEAAAAAAQAERVEERQGEAAASRQASSPVERGSGGDGARSRPAPSIADDLPPKPAPSGKRAAKAKPKPAARPSAPAADDNTASPATEAAPQEAAAKPSAKPAAEDAGATPAAESAPEEAAAKPSAKPAAEGAEAKPAAKAAPEEAAEEAAAKPAAKAAPEEPAAESAAEEGAAKPAAKAAPEEAEAKPTAKPKPAAKAAPEAPAEDAAATTEDDAPAPDAPAADEGKSDG
jgi:small subunit ribosomal protein S2